MPSLHLFGIALTADYETNVIFFFTPLNFSIFINSFWHIVFNLDQFDLEQIRTVN